MKQISDILKRPLTREVFFTLATYLFLIPQPYLTIPTLDASWQVVLEEAFFEGWEFGKVVNFTGGPLSFLYTPTSLGHYVYTQMAAESAVFLAALFLIYRALRGQVLWMSILVWICFSIGAAMSKDGIFLSSIFAAAFIIIRTPKQGWLVYAVPLYFVILSLMKFTFGTLAMFCILVLAAGFRLKKDTSSSIKLVSAYIAFFVLIWVTIGQNLLTLPSYFQNSLSISQGYLWNMQSKDPGSLIVFLVFFLILASIPIFLACLFRRKEQDSWLVLIIASATIFLAWKAGITRAGSHFVLFMQTAMVISFILKPYLSFRILPWTWVIVLVGSYFFAIKSFYPGGTENLIKATKRVYKNNYNLLTNSQTTQLMFKDIIPRTKREQALPEIREVVGNASVDVLHFQQAILFLNDLNYHPRPTVQNYQAYNHHLLSLNLQHILSNPPEYLLVQSARVDNRYPFSDDSLYNLQVFENYRPILSENGYLLLERNGESQAKVTDSSSLMTTIRSGEGVNIAAYSGDPIWLKVDYRPSILHRMWAFLYKPETLYIKVTLEDGSSRKYRLPSGVLEDGFLLNPLIDSNSALEAFLKSHKPGIRITSFTIENDSDRTLFRTKEFGLTLYPLKNLTASLNE
ncbi:MAG: hypothetical protein KJT03_02440 [Verrucomicrobiae bacterium]|nr:hypothetical protein [Verrucomicrobiae bacterium]